jgi:hypothetical protein
MCVGRDGFVGVFERYMDERTKCNDLKTISKKIVSQSGKSALCGPPGRTYSNYGADLRSWDLASRGDGSAETGHRPNFY